MRFVFGFLSGMLEATKLVLGAIVGLVMLFIPTAIVGWLGAIVFNGLLGTPIDLDHMWLAVILWFLFASAIVASYLFVQMVNEKRGKNE